MFVKINCSRIARNMQSIESVFSLVEFERCSTLNFLTVYLQSYICLSNYYHFFSTRKICPAMKKSSRRKQRRSNHWRKTCVSSKKRKLNWSISYKKHKFAWKNTKINCFTSNCSLINSFLIKEFLKVQWFILRFVGWLVVLGWLVGFVHSLVRFIRFIHFVRFVHLFRSFFCSFRSFYSFVRLFRSFYSFVVFFFVRFVRFTRSFVLSFVSFVSLFSFLRLFFVCSWVVRRFHAGVLLFVLIISRYYSVKISAF